MVNEVTYPPIALPNAQPPREPRLSHDRRILLMALASALPGALISLIFLWTGDYTPKVQWTLTVLIVTFCLGFAFALRERVVLPLQTLSNLLAALGEGDFSIRARGARGGDPLGEVMIEVNALVETLRHQRLDALEATTLLRKVMAEIDVAVFTFDEQQELKFVNRAGDAAAQPAGRAAARTRRRRDRPVGLPGRRGAARDQHGVSRRRRPLGDPAQPVPPGRPAARAAGALRSQPAAARGRAAGVAAADPRHRPRDEQLAGADQVDRRQPLDDHRPRAAAGRLARRHAARPRRHRVALRGAQPVHERLRAAGQAAAAEAGAARRRRRSSIAWRRSRRRTTSRSPPARR